MFSLAREFDTLSWWGVSSSEMAVTYQTERHYFLLSMARGGHRWAKAISYKLQAAWSMYYAVVEIIVW